MNNNLLGKYQCVPIHPYTNGVRKVGFVCQMPFVKICMLISPNINRYEGPIFVEYMSNY